jgi:hypothetical protein
MQCHRSLGVLYDLAQQQEAPDASDAPSATSGAAAQNATGTTTTGVDAKKTSEAWKVYEESYKELSKWVDVTGVDYVTTYSAFEAAAGRPANAVKVCSSVCEPLLGVVWFLIAFCLSSAELLLLVCVCGCMLC